MGAGGSARCRGAAGKMAWRGEAWSGGGRGVNIGGIRYNCMREMVIYCAGKTARIAGPGVGRNGDVRLRC